MALFSNKTLYKFDELLKDKEMNTSIRSIRRLGESNGYANVFSEQPLAGLCHVMRKPSFFAYDCTHHRANAVFALLMTSRDATRMSL